MRYHSQPFYDPYGYAYPPMPHPGVYRDPSPREEAPKVATPPAPAHSPNDERFAKLEMMIMAQHEMNAKRRLAKEALRDEEERKKEEKDKMTQTEKLIEVSCSITS